MKSSYRHITSFSFNYVDFSPLSSKSSAVISFNSLQSSKLSSNSKFSTFTQNSCRVCFEVHNSLFQLGTTSTQNSCFSPSAHKSSVTSASVKNVSPFSSFSSDNSLVSTAYLAICKANSNSNSSFR